MDSSELQSRLEGCQRESYGWALCCCSRDSAEAEHEAAQDVYQNARHGQQVRVDPAPREPLHHRADDPPRAASDARTEQLYKAFPRALDMRGRAPPERRNFDESS